MALLLTPGHFITKMEENIKRVDNRVNDFIKDSNENNIHDIEPLSEDWMHHLDHYQKSSDRKTRFTDT